MRSIVRATLVAALAACPSSKPNASAVQEICERYSTALLRHEARCAPEILPSSLEELLQQIPSACNNEYLKVVQAGVAAGRLEIDSALVDRCVAALAGPSCAGDEPVQQVGPIQGFPAAGSGCT